MIFRITCALCFVLLVSSIGFAQPEGGLPGLSDLFLQEHSINGQHSVIHAEDLMTEGPWADVRAYGARGDGATDDTAAIQAAIDSGKKVYLPMGSYMVTTLNISADNTIIVGDGMGKSILTAWGSGAVFDISFNVGTELKDFTIDGANKANYGIYLQDGAARRGRFTRLEIMNVRGDPGLGVATVDHNLCMLFDRCVIHYNRIGLNLIMRCQLSVIDRCLIYANTKEQVHLGDGTYTTRLVIIRDSQIERARYGLPGDVTGLVVEGVDPLIMDGVYFESHSTPASRDIHVTGYSRIHITGMYSNGANQASNSIVLDAPVDMTIRDSFLYGFNSDVIVGDELDGRSVHLFNVSRNYFDNALVVDGDVGIGTDNPECHLDVEGAIQAYEYYTGDIIFQKDGRKLWRMFEDEDGLYLEKLSTGEVSRVFLESDIVSLTRRIEQMTQAMSEMQEKIESLER